jgi:hypothetical protein
LARKIAAGAKLLLFWSCSVNRRALNFWQPVMTGAIFYRGPAELILKPDPEGVEGGKI